MMLCPCCNGIMVVRQALLTKGERFHCAECDLTTTERTIDRLRAIAEEGERDDELDHSEVNDILTDMESLVHDLRDALRK